MKSFNRSFFVLVLIFSSFYLLSAISAEAGLIMNQERYVKGKPEKLQGTIYMENNKVKFEDPIGQSAAVFNLDTGEMIQIDNKNKTYSIATVEDYVRYFEQFAERKKEEMKRQLKELPPDKRAEVEKMMKDKGVDISDNAKPAKISMNKPGNKTKIAGYESSKYEIFRGGVLKQEIWTSEEVGFGQEIDMEKMSEYMSELRKSVERFGSSNTITNKELEVYKEIYSSGFPLRTLDIYPDGTTIVEEVTRVVRKDIGAQSFVPPPGYKKVSLQQMVEANPGG